MSSSEKQSRADAPLDAPNAPFSIAENNALEEVNQDRKANQTLTIINDLLAHISAELIKAGVIPEMFIHDTVEVEQPPIATQSVVDVLPPGLQHSINAAGEEVYTFSNGLQISKNDKSGCTVFDASGKPLGQISLSQFEDIQGSRNLNLVLMNASGYVTVNAAGDTLITYSNGTEITSDSSGQTLSASFRNGASITMEDDHTYTYDDGQGTIFSTSSIPPIAPDGSVNVLGQTNDGRVVEFTVEGAAITETITSQSDHGLSTQTSFSNGVNVHEWSDSEGTAQQAIVVNEHVSLITLSDGSYQIIVNGQATSIFAEHVGQPDADGQINFSIDGHPCAVDAQGRLIYDFATANPVTLDSSSFTEPMLTLSGTNASGELESIQVSPLGTVAIESGPALSQFENHEITELTEGTEGSGDPEIDQELKVLADLAKQHYSGSELTTFLQNLDLLTDRYKDGHFDKAELMDAFKSVEKLMTMNANDLAITPANRDRLVWEELAIIADGQRYINQGQNDTCTVTSSLQVMAARYPSAVADAILQLATTSGEYTAADGTKVKIDMTPYGESLTYPTPDGNRSYCVQLMNVLMLNIGLQKEGLTTWEYREEATGTALYDLSDPNNPKRIGSKFALEGNEIEKVITAMVGTVEGPLIIDFKGNGAGAPATEQFETISDLREYLKTIRENNGFPVVVGVNTFNPPFSSGSPGGHVVTIEGYDPGPPERVLINNTWGQAADFLGNKAISLEEAFYMCMPPERPEQIDYWQRIVDEDERQGNFVLDHELQLLEFQVHQGKLTEDERIAAIEKLYKIGFEYWEEQKRLGNDDFGERYLDFYRLKNICSQLPTERALEVFNRVYQSGYMEPAEFEMELGSLVMEACRNQTSGGFFDHNSDAYKTLLLVASYVQLLSPQDRANFQISMKRWLEEAGFQNMLPAEFSDLLPLPGQSMTAPAHPDSSTDHTSPANSVAAGQSGSPD